MNTARNSCVCECVCARACVCNVTYPWSALGCEGGANDASGHGRVPHVVLGPVLLDDALDSPEQRGQAIGAIIYY